MFKTHAGPVEDEGTVAYLRPETAQGMFTNFANVLTTTRKKPPFGIAQVGKSFRNEITPQNFVFRTREFEQMEMEYFVPPAEAAKWFEYWLDERVALVQGPRHARATCSGSATTSADELSHYSSQTADIEFLFPWGWDELEGVANRGDFDLTRPRQGVGRAARVLRPGHAASATCPTSSSRPLGATRAMMAFLLAAYAEDEVGGGGPHRAAPATGAWRPTQVAVLPLSKKDSSKRCPARSSSMLQPHFMCDYDTTQSIGRRYRRQDEVGTPWCVTVDFDSLEDHAVTVRDRDTTDQVRVPVAGLLAELAHAPAPAPGRRP